MLKNFIKIFGLVVLLIVYNCSLKEPVLPSWFVNLSIPLSGETFKLSEFVNDSTIIAQGQDSLIFISINGEIDSTGLNNLSLDPQSDSGSINLGSIKLDSLKDLRADFTSLRDLMPGLSAFVGDTFTIPETSLVSLSSLVQSDEYERIHVTSGMVTLRLFNNLPLAIGPNSSNPNGLELELLNDSLNQHIFDIAIPDTIFPGQMGEGSDQIPPGGLWIYSEIRIDYDLPISQATTVFVTDSLLDSAGFWIELDFENFEADEVIAKIQGQVFSDKEKFELENENKLREGVVDRGAVHIDFFNALDLDSKVIFSLPNIRTPQNTAFTDSINIVGGGTQAYEVIIDDFRVINPDNPNEFIDSVTIDFAVFTSSASEFVHLTSMDSIAFIIQTDSILLQSFKGFLALDTLEVSEFNEDSIADYGDFSQGVLFQNAELSLSLTSGLLIENFSFDLNVTGYHTNENGVVTDSAFLNISQTVSSNGSPGNPDNIVITESGPQVANFLNILPTSLGGFGTISIEGEAEIFQNSQIAGNYLFSTPLRLEISNLAPIEGDVTMFIGEGDDTPYEGLTDTLDQDVIDLGEDLQSGQLELEIVNHTPVQVRIRMLVSSNLSRPDSAFFVDPIIDSLEFIKSGTLEGADTDPQSGFVINSRQSTIPLDLTKDEIRMLTQPPYKVGYEVKLFDSQGIIALRSTDFVRSFGLAKLIVKVEDE